MSDDWGFQYQRATDIANRYVALAKKAETPEERARLTADARKYIDYAKTIKPVNVADELNPVQKTQIGLGKSLSSYGEGAKQKYLMATDPEAAKEYTGHLRENERLWHETMPGIGPESLGVAMGYAAPAAFAPATGALRGGMFGAVEGAMVPALSGEPSEMVTNAMMGGGLGGAFGAMGGYRVNPNAMNAEQQAGVRYAAEHNLPLRPQDVSNAATARQLGATASALPMSARRTVTNAQRHVEEVQRAYEGGHPNAYSAFESRRQKLMDEENRLYDEAFSRIGHVPVDFQSIITETQGRLQKLWEQGGRDMASFKKVAQRLDTPPKDNTVEAWRKWRTNVRETERMLEKEGISLDPLFEMYDVVTNAIYKAAENVDPRGANALRTANRVTQKRAELAKYADKVRDQRALSRRFVNAGQAEADEIFRMMGPEGRRQLVHDVIGNALDKGANAGRASGFSPRVTAKELEKATISLERFLSPEQKASMDGLVAYLNTAKGAADDMALPMNGWKAIVAMGGPGAMAGAQMGGGGGALAGALMGNAVVPYLMRNKEWQGLARKLAAAESGSVRERMLAEQADRLLERLARDLTTNYATQTNEQQRKDDMDTFFSNYGKPPPSFN